MYSLQQYGEMIADKVRMNAFEEAIRRVVRPGDVVVDLGAGTGIMSLLACKYGASTVYAIEPSDFVHVAAQVVAENGFANRVRFYQGDSRQVELPERSDVIVSDLRGPVPWCHGHIPAIADARERFLKNGGTMIGRRDVVFGALIEAPGAYRRVLSPWSEGPLGFRMNAAVQAALNQRSEQVLNAGQLVGNPCEVATLDYFTLSSSDLDAQFEIITDRVATVHGLVLWFEAELAEGVRLSTSPNVEAPTVYGNLFFPLNEIFRVGPGSKVGVRLVAKDVGDEHHWSWITSWGEEPDCQIQRQSTVFHTPPSETVIRVPEPTQAHELTAKGRLVREVLKMVDGATSIDDLTIRVLDKFPIELGTEDEARHTVGSIVGRYAKVGNAG